MTLAAHEQDGLLGATQDLHRHPVFNDQKLKLGVFSSNCSGGVIMSDAPTGFRVTWDQQLEIARTADRLGMEAMVPVGRWTGFRGNTNFNGVCFETYTWAAGLAQATEDIGIFTTTHVPTVHPIVGAKMATTIDHISNGRFGMNLVMGWFTPEMELFGREQLPHDERYAYGQEWVELRPEAVDAVRRLRLRGHLLHLEGRPRLPQADPDPPGGAAQRRRLAGRTAVLGPQRRHQPHRPATGGDPRLRHEHQEAGAGRVPA
jgi:FMNH2-dependent dimethyl sulfone monooxygenase